MSEEITKTEFSEFQIKKLVRLFVHQNFLLAQLKAGSKASKLVGREEAWRDGCTLASEQEFDELFNYIADSNAEAAGEIAHQLAICMREQNVDFAFACSKFWFTLAQFEPFKKTATARYKALNKAELDAGAAKLFAHETGLELSQEGDEHLVGWTWRDVHESGARGELGVKIPLAKRYLAIADLLENTPIKREKGDKDFRSSVAYRIRTDASEIIKIASAACDMSATEFVEALALETSHYFVRGKIGAIRNEISEEKTHLRLEALIGRRLYQALQQRYQNEVCGGFFPSSAKTKATKNLKTGQFGRWFPEDDQPDKPKFAGETSKDKAMTWVALEMAKAKKAIDRQTAKLEKLTKLLEDLIDYGNEEDFTKILNDWVESDKQPKDFTPKEDGEKAEKT